LPSVFMFVGLYDYAAFYKATFFLHNSIYNVLNGEKNLILRMCKNENYNPKKAGICRKNRAIKAAENYRGDYVFCSWFYAKQL